MAHRDYVRRIVRLGGGIFEFVKIERVRCTVCGLTSRVLPDYILPFKHYRKDIIEGFVSGRLQVGDESLRFEDYPCDLTISRWIRSQKLQLA